MSRSTSDRLLSVAVTLPFLAAIAYLHLSKGVALKLFILGSGSWGFGCILKLVLYQGIIRRLPHDPAHILRTSTLNGLVSGVTEIGLALVFFALLPPLSLWEVVAFGVGIGTIEALMVATPSNPLKGTALEKASMELDATIEGLTGGRRWVYAGVVPPAERIIAGFVHVGTRGLAYVTIHTGDPMPVLIALAAFIVADGFMGYRLYALGRLSDLRVLNRVIAVLLAIAVLVMAAFAAYWRAT